MALLLPLFIFGVIQGLTEFLPVSSSGHLTVFQYFSESIEESLSLNIAVHLGTLLTVIIYYRRDIMALVRGFFTWDPISVKMVGLLLVASFPTGVIGILMKKNFEALLTHPLVAGICFFITAVILVASERAKSRDFAVFGFGIGWKQAFVVGLVQGFAVLPGISRSGSTIVSGLFMGMSPQNAARFSFLLSIPAIAGAGFLEFWGARNETLNISELAVGALVAFVVGLLAIHLMVRLTVGRQLKVFSYYLFPLGLSFLLIYALGWGQNQF